MCWACPFVKPMSCCVPYSTLAIKNERNSSMRRTLTVFLSLLLAVVLAVSPVTVNAVYLTDDTVADYTVISGETHTLGDGLVYNQFTFNDSTGREQVCFTMEFNPKTSPFRTYVYHTKASHGYTIVDDAVNAQADGLEVYAAINGDFFDNQNPTAYGTPVGGYLTAGKIVVANVGSNEYNLVIAKDGTADVVRSCPTYALTIGGVDYSSSFKSINRRVVTPETNKIYYFDSDIGTTSPVPVTATCTELVCDITSGALSIGDTISGTVSAINTKGGSAIGDNQFVIYVGSDMDMSAVAVGDSVSIAIDESIEESKEVMRNAEHAIYARYVLVHDGVDRYAQGEYKTDNPEAMDNLYAQRCLVGIKEDGSIVYMVCDGRRLTEGGPNGMPFAQLVEMMTELGCTEVVNFDGGGSTAVIVSEGDGKFNHEFIGERGDGTGRAVGNSILIVRDPNAEPKPAPSYQPIEDTAGTELRNVALNKPYTVSQCGIMTPKYSSSALGDSFNVKMTNGRYRAENTDEERHSTVFLGTGSQASYVINLEKQRTDLRNLTLKTVMQSGTYNFNANNVLIYVSDDGMNWSADVDFDIERVNTNVSGAKDYVFKFKEAQSAQYVKLVVGTPSAAMSFDEIEIYGMVDVNEPKEELLPEDPNTLPAETPSEECVNVALGKDYTFTCNGLEIAAHDATTEPRYYNVGTKETTPGKLTNGKIGTAGNFADGATLAVRAGADSLMEVTIDLGELTNDIEFVQILNMIDNGASFGHVATATVSVSTDGETYTEHGAREALSAKSGTQYYSLTLQLRELASARYVKVSFNCSKFLIGLGEVTVLTTKPEPAYTIGDVDADDYVDNTDASLILKYDAGIQDLDEIQLLAGDVDADGYVDNTDASLILKYDAGIIDSLE